MRDLELADIQPLVVEGDGPRMLLALLANEQDGGHAADGITLLGIALDEETLFQSIRGLVKVKDYGRDVRCYRLCEHEPETMIPMEECGFDDELFVLSVPVGTPLDLSLQNMNEHRALRASSSPTVAPS
jgi:hypothetical protein